MKKITVELPAMFGDHHVQEVRRILFELPGVEDVYASSGFRLVEVSFDEGQTKAEMITDKLEQAGYLGEIPIPVETGTSGAQENGRQVFFRHTAAFVQTKNVVGFQQRVPFTGRPLWPCPGMGPIPTETAEESN
jgi:copper chaperone CopZ